MFGGGGLANSAQAIRQRQRSWSDKSAKERSKIMSERAAKAQTRRRTRPKRLSQISSA